MTEAMVLNTMGWQIVSTHNIISHVFGAKISSILLVWHTIFTLFGLAKRGHIVLYHFFHLACGFSFTWSIGDYISCQLWTSKHNVFPSKPWLVHDRVEAVSMTNTSSIMILYRNLEQHWSCMSFDTCNLVAFANRLPLYSCNVIWIKNQITNIISSFIHPL